MKTRNKAKSEMKGVQQMASQMEETHSAGSWVETHASDA